MVQHPQEANWTASDVFDLLLVKASFYVCSHETEQLTGVSAGNWQKGKKELKMDKC